MKEWKILAPWGKICLISWGNPRGYPVLLIHGRQDSAATFIPLLDLLPERYHYVAIDLPGHGKSDPFPIGVMLQRFHFVTAVDIAVRHLGWFEFFCLAHSLGTEQGLYFNAIFPKRIKKFILLDPGPPFEKILMVSLPEYGKVIEKYYKRYDEYNNDTRVYTKKKALDSVKRARGLTDDQANLILSRNLKEIGPDLYQLSWDKRLKLLTPVNQTDEEYYLELFSKSCPPTLLISAKDSLLSEGKEVQEFITNFFSKWQKSVDNLKVVNVEGGHDVHVTNPERLAKYICEFLEKDNEAVIAKL